MSVDNTAARQRGNKRAAYIPPASRKGGWEAREGATRRKKEGYKILIRQSFAEVTFCIGLLFLFFFLFFCQFPSLLAPPERRLREWGRQIL